MSPNSAWHFAFAAAGVSITEKEQLIERIATSADRLDYLINDLLDFSRLERGLVKVSPEPVCVRDLVGGAVARVGPAIEHH